MRLAISIIDVLRRQASGWLIGMCCLVVSACAQDDQTSVRFWALGAEADCLSTLLQGFRKEHPDIQIILQSIPVNASHEKLLTAYAAGALPDVFQLGNTWLAEFSLLGSLEPLQPLVQTSQTIDPGDYFPGVWAGNQIQGQLIGIPWYVDTRLLFYRKDLLFQAGVPDSLKTWEDWQRAMSLLAKTRRPDQYAILMPLNEFEQQLSFALQQPDPLLRDHNRYGNFQSPGFRRALQFYHSLFTNGWAPKISDNEISNVWYEFFNGKYVFYLSGPWNIREFRLRQPFGMSGKWGTMPLPSPDGQGGGIAGGSSLVIRRASPHKQAAWMIVEYLSRPAVQAQLHQMVGDLPPRRTAWQQPSLANDPLAQAFKTQLESVRSLPQVLEWEQIVQQMRITTEQVVLGRVAEDKAVTQLNQHVDAILAKHRWIEQQQDITKSHPPR